MSSCEYASWVTASAVMGGAGRPEKGGDGEVEAVPEEMDGAGLATEPAAELLEHAVRPVENAAVALDRVAIPGGVLAVLRERRRHQHAERLLLDLDVDSQLVHRLVQLGVEAGDRETVGEGERAAAALMGANP